jgi:hypothetical protein
LGDIGLMGVIFNGVDTTAGTSNDIVRRVKEGWSIVRSTVPAITQARTQLGDR